MQDRRSWPGGALGAALLATAAAAAAAGSDVYLSSLVAYADLAEGSPEAEQHGTRPQVEVWDLHAGLAPRQLDVVAVVNGERAEPVNIVLEVVPVVGVTNWAATEGITEPQLLQVSKTPLAVLVRREQQQALDGRIEVTFEGLDLGAIIDHYRALDLWPAELVLRVVAEPLAGETALDNNVMELRLPLHPPD